MKRFLVFLAAMAIPSLAFADVAPHRHIPCEDCVYRCFDCCTMQDIVPMPGCSSCYHGGCNFEPICAEYLAKNPGKCPDSAKQDNPNSDIDENHLPQPELKDSDVDNTQPMPDNNVQPKADDNIQPKADTIEDHSQVPPPVESKRSCSAMMYSSGQTGVWAILAVLFAGFLAFVMRRRSRQ